MNRELEQDNELLSPPAFAADKPAGSAWTDEQWEAISRTGQNILVAAAAGSGKTAVLVERIIRRISDESESVDVDRLLVATFTKAAASEMRQRIRDALEKALFEKPDSAYLRKQLALLNRASITTLHSFCLEVIQRYFQLIRLDPGFRVANETETALLRQDVLEELFEHYYTYSEEDSEFWNVLEWFGGNRSDEALFSLVLQLYDASRSHPQPDRWLDQMCGLFDTDATEPTLWLDSLEKDVRLDLEGILGLLTQASHLAAQPGGPAPYLDNLTDEIAMTEQLIERCGESWESLYVAFQTASFGRLKACRGDGLDKALQDQVKAVRDAAKERFNAMREELFTRSPEQYKAELMAMHPIMSMLAELVKQFGKRFSEAKRGKGLIDFADLEHYCLQVLTDPDSPTEELKPSEAALEYREQYVEILLDEYQDTNLVQEAIVELLSREDRGNRFMVGDVKQSIYRFRLAEPGLFLDKYRSFRRDGSGRGRRIDLARNFRSRRQVVDGVNFVFKQVMNETVGEIAYDREAELVYGAEYYERSEQGAEVRQLPVEWMLIDRAGESSEADSGGWPTEEPGESAEIAGAGGQEPGPVSITEEIREMETAQMEARAIALQIRKLLGEDGGEQFTVYDKRENGMRPVQYRDIVVLLRATHSWAPVFIEELRQQGIPGYADLNTGYFSATEVDVVLSLLKIIDNPYQDIPLAGVLRSPIVGLSADDLAIVRMTDRKAGFYGALLQFTAEQSEEHQELRHKLAHFISRLEQWRTAARQGTLADLIWSLYRDTGYYDFVGGMPGGLQRQANLRALHDRARQYEATSFRGLFRFLRFVERMQESGGDLGTARALGEQEDVVRIMSIHKSKGLEFPVVFVAGMGKGFNRQDLNSHFLIHKELGLGPYYVDMEKRISFPSLPTLAIRRRMRLEMLAEEMRVLYVALTRAREKLYLLGSVRSLAKQLDVWARTDLEAPVLADYELAQAKCYLDWIGPALIKHRSSQPLREMGHMLHSAADWAAEDPSEWKVSVIYPAMLAQEAAAAEQPSSLQEARLDAVRRLLPVDLPDRSEEEEVARRLGWAYPFAESTQLLSNTSVSELKRMHEEKVLAVSDDTAARLSAISAFQAPVYRRPRFMEQRQMNAAERGTIHHAVMQRVRLHPGLDEAEIVEEIQRMVDLRLLTEEQRQAVDPSMIAGFFQTDVGRRLLAADRVKREVPFSYGLPAREVYPKASPTVEGETILIQGVIDCLFEDEEGLVLLDYKTDAMRGRPPEELAERYSIQLGLYTRAIERIWQRELSHIYLYFFDGSHLVRMDNKIKPLQGGE
ncbi:helicase-exonuclease AddAB subunit AddA [Paenibacillus sp. J2TS4]|uniref:helicase-exonuclease AddAB subunit AddA n=1 Tax=Paenibacillus sp. J2TS4 TaxID=2807194 RepID=UPI001B28B5DB|nr:helicase-exonuclease AddAB subunit AddA [Paenibacillus sp. J2TS4]GIP35843.1 ATP-dependent helicase/nuclease subunit A [Paenibacillus sp. J2TS4]